MWVLKFLPDWIFYGILFVGIIGLAVTYLLRFIPIPALYFYKTPIQLISIAMIVIGVYMAGAISNEHAWQARVKELEAKIAEAEAASQKENVKIVEKVVSKLQVVKERGQDIIKYVDREVVKYDIKCEIPKEFMEVHNKAAEPVK